MSRVRKFTIKVPARYYKTNYFSKCINSPFLKMCKVWMICIMAVFESSLIKAESCIEPPLECPNKNITYWLYTSSTQEEPHELFTEESASITEAPFVRDAPIKILIHGYTGHRDFSPNTEIRPAYFQRGEYNVISVDYNPIAREPCYIQAAHNIQLVGKCTAQLIDVLVKEHGYPLSQFHVIGFSLGGQTAGAISNYLEAGLLDRVTGLDPAMPLFVTHDNTRKLDAGDAHFVDVLHTNALVKGKLEQSGQVDFYANGGLTQPGCLNQPGMTKSGCDHARAPAYYAESITSDQGFYGTRCFSWIAYMIGWCELEGAADEVLFGEDISNKSEGLYFFRTNSEPPYARGRRQGGLEPVHDEQSGNGDDSDGARLADEENHLEEKLGTVFDQKAFD